MDSIWPFLQKHDAEIAAISIPLLLWTLNVIVKKAFKVFNLPFFGSDIAFCGVTLSFAATLRLCSALEKPHPNSDPLLSSLTINLVLLAVQLVLWVFCLAMGSRAFELQKFRDETLRKLGSGPLTHSILELLTKLSFRSLKIDVMPPRDLRRFWESTRREATIRIALISCCSVWVGGIALYLAISYAWFTFPYRGGPYE